MSVRLHPDSAQRAHHYRHLIARWRTVARAAGVTLRPLAAVGEFTVYYLENPAAWQRRGAGSGGGGFYASAGIHGDEVGGTEGLLAWAQADLAKWNVAGRERPFFLVPCLNPWGLTNNRRVAADGTDLNRIFHRNAPAPVGELMRLLARRRFVLALTLHEDYDAQGLYLYELSPRAELDLGEQLLDTARALDFPVDTRRTIEVRRVTRLGLLRMRRNAALRLLKIPAEAIWLYQHVARQVFTIETPSEFSLSARAALQARLMRTCLEQLEARTPQGFTGTSAIGEACGK
ncbi:MAG: DUF2817 domain-containing protein [Verrucomicrobia bacterium]|nr:DUF2817 domain-containing protein [Verrucomicrobiota bacterium]